MCVLQCFASFYIPGLRGLIMIPKYALKQMVRKAIKVLHKNSYLTKKVKGQNYAECVTVVKVFWLVSWMYACVERCQFIAIKNSEEYTLCNVARCEGSKGVCAFTRLRVKHFCFFRYWSTKLQ